MRDVYGDINEFKKDYKRRTNLVKDEIGELLADSHVIFNICMYMALMISGRQKITILPLLFWC